MTEHSSSTYRTSTNLRVDDRFLASVRSLGAGPERLGARADRYRALMAAAARRGHDDVLLLSVPGRTELAGNHTDHNRGEVIAAAIDIDAAAVVASRPDRAVHFSSATFPPFDITLDDLAPRTSERGSTAALVRGVAAWFVAHGHTVGGFDAFVQSDVLPGSGLSSSAVVETLVGTALSHLCNGGNVPALGLALAGQHAENSHFGKPCGLMDQIACAFGGVVAIDFASPLAPAVTRLEVDFSRMPFQLLIVDTGGSHADLTADYAAVPDEMRAVAEALGATACRDLDVALLVSRIPGLRSRVGDRALLRALHFVDEHGRVARQAAALRDERFAEFLALVRESGLSSYRLLQNIAPPAASRDQGVALALALTERFLDAHGGGACRVHGGGFAGTIQAYVARSAVEAYRASLEPVFGPGSVTPVSVRTAGAVVL